MRMFMGHQASGNLDKVREHHPRVQRWLEFTNACQSTLQYRKRMGNSDADLLSGSPVDATESNVHDPSRITHEEDVDVYYVGASGLRLRPRCSDYTTHLSSPFADI